MTNNRTILEKILFLWNPVTERIVAFFVFFWSLLLMYRFRKRCLQWLHKYSKYTVTSCDDFVIESIQKLPRSFFYIVSLYAASQFLILWDTATSIIYVLFVIVAISQIWLTIWRVILHILQNHYFEWEQGKHTVWFLRMVVNLVVWSIVLLMILNNLWVAIAPLITSLWIVWVAVAFSLKNILEDLFSSISLFIDKPFIIWDYIEIDGLWWSVTSIWIKTTRILTTRGEELVVANRNLTNETLRNYWKMDHRTITEKFTIPYLDDITIYEKIIVDIKELFWQFEKKWIELKRVFMTWITEKGAEFSYRFTIQDKDYTLYRETQQSINIWILVILQKYNSWIAAQKIFIKHKNDT